MEIWKDIPKYESYYQVSNLGRVKSFPRNGTGKKEKILKPDIVVGYGQVRLCKNGYQKVFKVHRLVGLAFIPNPKNKPCINHKNNVHNDNRVENLEWCTYKENTQHALKNGLIKHLKGEQIKNSKLNEYQVLKIRSKYIPFKYSTYRLAKEYDVCQMTIQLIISNKIWKHI